MDTAKRFESAGAKWIHMVDLDGAKDGTQQNYEFFVQVAKETGLKVELGGGIRSLMLWKSIFQKESPRDIGSAAVKNPITSERRCEGFGERIAVGIDAKTVLLQLKVGLRKAVLIISP